MMRAEDVAPKCLIRSLAKKEKNYSLKVAIMWPKHGKKRR